MATSATDASLGALKLDALVATYAPIGVQKRQQARRRRGLLAAAGIASTAVLTLLVAVDVSLPGGVTSWFAAPGASLSADELQRLRDEQSLFASRLADLEQGIVEAREQKRLLELRQAELGEQSQRVALLLDQFDSAQTAAPVSQQPDSRLDRELAAMAEQREKLAARWAHFEAQGELLAMEITAVNVQRKELEAQRRQIDRQQRALAELLDRAEGLYRRAAGSVHEPVQVEPTTATTEATAYTYTYNSLVADANDMVADDGQLDRMRGGFSIGEGLDISFGFTQTGAINGVEQFNNHFTINSVGRGMDNVDLSNMNPVIVQNGTGNFVSPDVLDSMATSFGSIIQNTLDNQEITTTTTYDIALHNVPGTLQGLAGEQALLDSLSSYR